MASKSRGLLSLMRRHRHNLKPEQRLKLQVYLNGYPALDPIYRVLEGAEIKTIAYTPLSLRL